MTKAAPCAAILLAAGLSSRYRAELEAQSQTEAPSKLLAEMNGRPLVRHVAEAALASQASPLIVVTGYEQDLITASLAGLPVQFIHNADYATGMASSLRIGIAAVPPDCSAAVILLGDMPQIKADLINQLIAALSQNPQAKALVPTFVNAQGQEERGNPVVLTRSLFAEIGRLSGDQGARKLLSGEGVLEVPVADPAIVLDIDTPEALARLQSSLTQKSG